VRIGGGSKAPDGGCGAPEARAAPGGRDASEALPARLVANDPDAIRTVARWIGEITRNRAWGFETPEDISQETLLALVQNIRDQRFAGGDFRAYVRRIAKNIAISSYRRARRRGVTLSLEDVSEPLAARGDGQVEAGAAVARLIATLDEACRRLVVMAYLRGRSRREIAANLRISEGAAKVRLFRCLEKIRLRQAQGGAGAIP
jgi:RNA polymerase sigma factor (sigma-70 family)